MAYTTEKEKRQMEIRKQIKELQQQIFMLAQQLDKGDELRLRVYNAISNEVQEITHTNELALYRKLVTQVKGWNNEQLQRYVSQTGMLQTDLEETLLTIIRVANVIDYFEAYSEEVANSATYLLNYIRTNKVKKESLLRCIQIIGIYNEHDGKEMVDILNMCIEIVEGGTEE